MRFTDCLKHICIYLLLSLIACMPVALIVWLISDNRDFLQAVRTFWPVTLIVILFSVAIKTQRKEK